MALENGIGRKITRDETMSIIEKNQEQGLVLQPSNTKKAEFICSCCGCCCGMLVLHKNLPKPLDFWATNFHAVVNKNTCEGCGVCVSNCPTESISLLKNPIEVIPPQTREELFDIIMDRKKGRFGKLMLKGKLYLDAFRTGQTHLLKP